MRLIPYSVLLIIHAGLGVLLLALPWLLTSEADTSARIALSVFGLIYLILSVVSQSKPVDTLNLVPTRLTTLGYFLVSILVSFSPYLFGFSQFIPLVWSAIAASSLSLLSLVFANFETSATS